MITSYSIASIIIDEATNKFGNSWKVDEKDLDIFKQYCEYIDKLAEEVEAEAYDIEVNDDKTIRVSIECPDVCIDNPEHAFYDLVVRTVKFSLTSNPDTDNLLINFTFPSLWIQV